MISKDDMLTVAYTVEGWVVVALRHLGNIAVSEPTAEYDDAVQSMKAMLYRVNKGWAP